MNYNYIDALIRLMLFEEPKPWTKTEWSLYGLCVGVILLMIGDVYV